MVRPLSAIPERPALRLRWEPATIVFVAAGKAPYKLAVGRAGMRPASVALHQVAPGFSERELLALEAARPGEAIEQNQLAHSADGAAPVRARGDKQVWLWALLVGGVVALGAMAWHLLRQLKDGAPGSPPA